MISIGISIEISAGRSVQSVDIYPPKCYHKQRRLGVAQFGSVLEWGSRGRRFKSFHPDQNREGTPVGVPSLFLYWKDDLHLRLASKHVRGSRGECRRAAGKRILWIVFQARTSARVPQASRSGRALRPAEGSNPFTQTKIEKELLLGFLLCFYIGKMIYIFDLRRSPSGVQGVSAAAQREKGSCGSFFRHERARGDHKHRAVVARSGPRRFKSFHPDQNREGTLVGVPSLFLYWKDDLHLRLASKPVQGSRGECRRAAGKRILWIVFQARTSARVPQAERSGRVLRAAKVQILSPRPN